MHIKYLTELTDKDIALCLGILEFKGIVAEGNKELWTLINKLTENIIKPKVLEEVNKNENIAAARLEYKKCGKDPNRYRPSAESLTRRIIKGYSLYKVNNVVDVLNYISLKSGISIGGYNKDKINDEVQIGVGKNGEDYSGIGRGKLNIEGLPVLRDSNGAFGTPTSDSERTKIDDITENIVFVFFDFKGLKNLRSIISETKQLLEHFCNAKKFEINILNAPN